MKYSSKQYAFALHQALSESRPQDQEKILDNFVKILKENGDLGRFEEIESQFLEISRIASGVKLAEIASARELTKPEEAKIVQELNEYIGGKVEIKKKVDQSLIGGVVIRVGDERIDGSVKGNLMDLKTKLTDANLSS